MRKHLGKLLHNLIAITALTSLSVGSVLAYNYVGKVTYADTQDDLDAVNRDLDELRKAQAGLDSKFSELNDQLSSTGEKISELNDKIKDTEADIAKNQAEIERMQKDADERREAMKLRIKFMYEKGSYSSIDFIFQAESLKELLAKTEYVKQLTEYDNRKLEELSNLVDKEKLTAEKLNNELTELKGLVAEANDESNHLNSLLSECKTTIDTNSQNIKDAEALALAYEKKLEQENFAKRLAEIAAAKGSTPSSEGVNPETIDAMSINFSASDLELLAAIVECEAGNQSYEGKLAVASVVINRVVSERFDNTISEVIFAPNQFYPADSGRLAIVLARGAMDSCVEAAKEAMSGHTNIDAYYFHVYNPAVDFGGTVIGDHVFY